MSMEKILNMINSIPWQVLIIGSLTLGLAPFLPEPHLFEKLRMLFKGTLSKPIDIFDLILHGTIPLLLLVKIVIHFFLSGKASV